MINTAAYNKQVDKAKQRLAQRWNQQQRNEKLIKEKKFLSIDTPDRVEKFLCRRGYSENEVHSLQRNNITARNKNAAGAPGSKMLEIIMGDNNLMAVSFLKKGVIHSSSTGRIRVNDASAQQVGFATGFMVSPVLLLTNHHVLGDESFVKNSLLEFNYQLDVNGSVGPSVLFNFDPAKFYYKDENLDFVLIAVKEKSVNGDPLTIYGWNKLIEDEGKAIAGQYINIIQHPNGDPKLVCVRDNQLIDIFDDFMHYNTDTMPGSSGSALYNDQWEVVGLHHASVTVDAKKDAPKYQNEGVRISRIIKFLKDQNMKPSEKELFQKCFEGSESAPVFNDQPAAANGFQLQTVQNEDGSATWTIPISITLNVGNSGFVKKVATPELPPVPLAPSSLPVSDGSPFDQILARAKNELRTAPHVLDIDNGYKFRDGQITNEKAIVITMDSNAAAAERKGIPDEYMGVPTEVLGPGIQDLIIQSKNGPAREMLVNRHDVIEEIVYKPPHGAKLAVRNAKMKATFHISPEEGFKNLKLFLAGTTSELVIGMYDFGAPHILDEIKKLNKKHVKVSMAIQKGESLGTGTKDDDGSDVKKDDLHDADVIAQLQKTFKNNFDFSYVKIGKTNGWVASSYHIKVAVRDSKSIWLSSGNWQSSNQPDVAKLGLTDDQLISRYNREWHVIVEDEALAKAYRTFILNDIEENKKLLGEELTEVPALPELFAKEIATKAKKPYVPFPPKVVNTTLKVMPLLTPDNYLQQALDLIDSAKESLWIENQTFNAPNDKGTNTNLQQFLEAVHKKQQDGVGVKIIFRLFMEADAKRNFMALKDFGFDTDNVKVLKNCHTKGIIVDGKTVLLGSQNISEQGISINRDASLIVYNSDVADYFGKIFMDDWTNRATNTFSGQDDEMLIARPGQKIPPGMQRVSWKEIMETL
jgi:V8-like Glu-specific endopeptidase